MSVRNELYLPEEIFLLASNDEKGTIKLGSYWATAVGGAILAELLLRGRVVIADDKKKQVSVTNGVPLGEPVLDECLALVVAAKKLKSAPDWVQKFSGLKKLKQQVAGGLVARGILCEEEGRVLRFFKRTVYPEHDSRPEREVVQRLRSAIFTDTRDVTPRTTLLVALAQETYLLQEVFDQKKLKERRRRIEELTTGQVAGLATKEAVQAVQAAAAMAAIMPAIMVAATSTSH